MTFAHPWLLWIIVPCFLLWLVAVVGLWLLDARGHLRSSTSLRFSSAHMLAKLPPGGAMRLRQVLRASRFITVGLLLCALLRPQTARPGAKIWSQGVDIMLALDTSGSMLALDLDADQPIPRRRTRLQVVKDVVKSFVEKRPTDQMGMVVFGGEAFTQCPLTLDHDMVKTFLQRVEPGMAGDTTAIGSGIAAAINRLRRSSAKSKVIILLTDGSNNAGTLTPKKAAELAQTFHIKIYTIGAANRGPAPFLQDGLFGKQIQYAKIDLDEPTLKQIAEITGGAYFRAEDSRALVRIYDQIDAMEKTDLSMKSFTEYDEHFTPWVIGALMLLVVETVALGTRWRKLP